ncbi:hypothetical protein HELRODRAFT_181202 [Helobdella robusta]|uniref:Uncharacterized protein n=1 Tax=Helobdella robusta TaxID=6412 RepID=T1FGQ5_HELRO|nr:hypothetical protein HELRODRAFT_181202 [Helobdella robusta]ESN93258.1 hypothetical protein HELRODRAFT_181202 [Helobdella robusta]
MDQHAVGDRLFSKNKLKTLLVENKRETVKLNDKLHGLKNETNFEISKTNIEIAKLKTKLVHYDKRKVEFERQKNTRANRFGQKITSNNSDGGANERKPELSELELISLRFEKCMMKSIKNSVESLVVPQLNSKNHAPTSHLLPNNAPTSEMRPTRPQSPGELLPSSKELKPFCISFNCFDYPPYDEILITKDDNKLILTKIFKKQANLNAIIEAVNDIVDDVENERKHKKFQRWRELVESMDDEYNMTDTCCDTTAEYKTDEGTTESLNNHSHKNHPDHSLSSNTDNFVSDGKLQNVQNVNIDPTQNDVWSKISEVIFENDKEELSKTAQTVKKSDEGGDVSNGLPPSQRYQKVMIKLAQILKCAETKLRSND